MFYIFHACIYYLHTISFSTMILLICGSWFYLFHEDGVCQKTVQTKGWKVTCHWSLHGGYFAVCNALKKRYMNCHLYSCYSCIPKLIIVYSMSNNYPLNKFYFLPSCLHVIVVKKNHEVKCIIYADTVAVRQKRL